MDQRLKRQSEKHKEVKAKPTLNKNTADIGTNKIHAVQSGKKNQAAVEKELACVMHVVAQGGQ